MATGSARPGQIAADSEDVGRPPTDAGALCRAQHPRHGAGPQIVGPESSIVQHSDEWDAVGEIGEIDLRARDGGHLLLGRHPEGGQRRQRPPRPVGQPGQDLLPGELRGGSGPGGERQPHQGRPTVQRTGQPGMAAEPAGQRGDLDVGEDQFLLVQPQDVTGRLQPGQRDIRCGSSGQHQMGGCRQVSHQPAQQLRARRIRGQLVHVVEQDADLQRRDPDQRVGDLGDARGDGNRHCGVVGPTRSNGVQDRSGEPPGVLMRGVTADPDIHPARFEQVGPDRLGKHRGLAEARSGAHHGDGVLPPLVQSAEQPQPRQFDVQWPGRADCPIENTRRRNRFGVGAAHRHRWAEVAQGRLIHAGQESAAGAQIPPTPTAGLGVRQIRPGRPARMRRGSARWWRSARPHRRWHRGS